MREIYNNILAAKHIFKDKYCTDKYFKFWLTSPDELKTLWETHYSRDVLKPKHVERWNRLTDANKQKLSKHDFLLEKYIFKDKYYEFWLNMPDELKTLWENDESCTDVLEPKDGVRWNQLTKFYQRILLKHGKFEYLFAKYADYYIFDIPIDIYWMLVGVEDFSDIVQDYEYQINDVINDAIADFGLEDTGKMYTVDQILSVRCFLNCAYLIFYDNAKTTNKNLFPIPSYDPIPIENIKRWKALYLGKSEKKQAIELLTWLEDNIDNNELDDIYPMNRLYG